MAGGRKLDSPRGRETAGEGERTVPERWLRAGRGREEEKKKEEKEEMKKKKGGNYP